MTCPIPCPFEATTQDALSPGPVANDEAIARGAYDPSQGNAKTGNIKLGVVARKDLLANQLSVWRLAGDPPRITIDDLATRLQARTDLGTLFAIVSTEAETIRSLRSPTTGGRAFCVRDECDCDQNGNKHPAHAHVAICNSARGPGFSVESPDFVQIHRDLAHAFKANKVWEAPKAA